jgi:hypothetical protein
MRPAAIRTLATTATLSALALRCGPAEPRLSHTLSDRTAAVLARGPQVYAPTAAAAAQGGETEALRVTFESMLDPAVRARLRHDPALDLVADAAAENFSDQGLRTSPALMQWMFWRSGSLALYLDHSGGYTGRSRRSQLEDWARTAAEHLNEAPGRFLAYGVARFTAGKITTEEMVVGESCFDAPPLPKAYAPGGPITLALAPRTPLREIRFLLDRGDAVDAQILPPRPDGSFFVSQAAPSKPGRYFIEIQGPGPNRRTLFTIPIYVGVPEPPAPDDFLRSPPPGPADLAGWPAWLAAVYGAERAKLGRSPLSPDPRLAILASERSARMAEGRRVAAIDAQALAAAGVSPGDLTEVAFTIQGTDAVLLDLLRPSTRERLVLSPSLRFAAGVTPRPVKENRAPSYMLVEETAP